MLTESKVQEVLSLIKQGFVRSKIARITGICRKSVYNIERDIHRRRPQRCPVCGHLILSPCRICASRQARTSVPFSFHGAESFSFPVLGLDLKGDKRRRYFEMRRKVEKEINEGTRTALSAIEN